MNIGTIYYMAPELLKNTGAYDKSIDIWALGCIWYYLVANVDLFTGIYIDYVQDILMKKYIKELPTLINKKLIMQFNN